MAKLKDIRVSLKLPFGSVEGQWEPDEAERRAAWELYVELVTRVAVADFRDGEALLRETLTSLHSLFGITRLLLRQYGPTVAVPKRAGDVSFGYLAVAVLNRALRPFLSKWHPRLLDWEAERPPASSLIDHEAAWGARGAMLHDLHAVQMTMRSYADVLAQVAGVASLLLEAGTGEGAG